LAIAVQSLTKRYGTQVAVNNISFQLKQGEITGFLGPNGAGKSTTMKMITGYLQADEGQISVCGLPVAKDQTGSKKKIGYLPESNPLYPDMYVREYLGFVAGIHQVPQAAKRIEEVIALVGLEKEAHKKTGQLSKGYKQRVGLAAALLHNPEVLILDEPTTGLDPNQIIEIREVIRQLGKTKTVLFSSHIMQEVDALCQRVIIINKGNIVADAPIAELRNKTGNERIISVQFNQPLPSGLVPELSGASHIQLMPPAGLRITCNNEEALRKQLLQWSMAQQLDILSLQTESLPLEEVFKALTR
jgi:ABC-2 type transport system ATP-binding protein